MHGGTFPAKGNRLRSTGDWDAVIRARFQRRRHLEGRAAGEMILAGLRGRRLQCQPTGPNIPHHHGPNTEFLTPLRERAPHEPPALRMRPPRRARRVPPAPRQPLTGPLPSRAHASCGGISAAGGRARRAARRASPTRPMRPSSLAIARRMAAARAIPTPVTDAMMSRVAPSVPGEDGAPSRRPCLPLGGMSSVARIPVRFRG